MPSSTTLVAARDGTPLLIREWPPTGSAWLHVLIVHGLQDHSGRFRRVGDQYGSNGVAVHSWDQRFGGGSSGRRGDVQRWDDLLDDMEDRLTATRMVARGVPVAIHAHSLGGLLAADYLLAGRPRPDLAVLSAPALDDGLARWKHALVPVAARLLPTVPLANGIDPEMLARDRSDPELFGPDPGRVATSSLRLGAFGFAAQDRVRASLASTERAPAPLLVIHGSADVLVPTAASEPFAALADVERIVYPDLRHELHNEPEGPAVVADIVGWLRRQVGVRADGGHAGASQAGASQGEGNPAGGV